MAGKFSFGEYAYVYGDLVQVEHEVGDGLVCVSYVMDNYIHHTKAGDRSHVPIEDLEELEEGEDKE